MALLVAGPTARGAEEGAPLLSSESPPAQARPAGLLPLAIPSPSIKTTVVGMTLQGVKKFDRVAIFDFDILVQTDGDRLLPLLRTLRVLGIEVKRSGASLTFQPEGSAPVALDPGRGVLDIGGTVRDVEVVSGTSDITSEPEIYIPERPTAEILGLEIEWKPDLYEYTFRSTRPLRVFERSDRRWSASGGNGFESYALPGNLPPTGPARSVLPRLLFAKVQLQTSAIRRGNETRTTGTLSPPRAALWAQLLGGSLATRVSQKSGSPRDGFKMDALSWNTVFDETAVSLGSGNVGLSQLVFPSLSLVGATVNGNVGPSSNLGQRDPSQLGKRQTFAPLHVFEGFAPLGSEVSLYVNGGLVETKKVEPTPGAPPGEGTYRFEGLNLFTSNLSEVRIVSKAPDGTVEESLRRVLGTDLLLSRGRAAFVGVAGRKRRFDADDFSSAGTFGGGRIDYGITQRLTLGASGGFQRDLFQEEDLDLLGEDLRRPPPQTLHLGTRVIWQPLDPLLFSAEAARSGWSADSSTGGALRADGEYHLRNLALRSGFFRYEPRFFDGQSSRLNDIQGGHLGASLRYGKGQQVGLVVSRMRDNLDNLRSVTTRLSEAQASWSVRDIVPRSVLTLGGRQVWVEGLSQHRSYLLGLESSLPWKFELRGRYEFGEDIRGLLRSELSTATSERFDLPSRMHTRFDVPGSSIGSGSLNSLVELRRRATGSWQLSMAHRSAGTLERTSFDLVRSAPTQSRWQARTSSGYDWNLESPFFQNRLEVFLEQSRRNRIYLETSLADRDWFTRISLQLQLDFGFSGFAPVPLFDSRIDPDAGGVKGRVFLDQNGNGLPDPGERGMEGIHVTSDLGRRTVSGNDGMFMFANSSNQRRIHVRLDPATLSAEYTATQGKQEALLRPGVFTEVNLGIAMLGTVTGVVLERRTADSTSATEHAVPAPGGTARTAERIGVAGVKVLLVGDDGHVAGFSITGSNGVYTIVEVKPGRYRIRPDEATLPEKFQLDVGEVSVEVRSENESVDLKAADLTGHYTRPKVDDGTKKEIEYKIFR